jgi:subtilisin-like proprotein convertase family protein
VGILHKWSLDINPSQATGGAHGEAAPGIDIPDEDPNGVSSTITVDQQGTIQNAKVGIDITHTYIGDLTVELISPGGSRVTLHNRAGKGKDNLITTFDASTVPAMAVLKGQKMQGNWMLKISDVAGRDVGKLNKWSIDLV